VIELEAFTCNVLANVALQKIKQERFSEHSIQRSGEHSSESKSFIFYERHFQEKYYFEHASTRAFARNENVRNNVWLYARLGSLFGTKYFKMVNAQRSFTSEFSSLSAP
jgi:hypothetical protein